MTDNGSPVNADKADFTAEHFPLRLRVHALARMLESTSRDVLAHLGELGVTARTAQSSISRDDAYAVAQRLGATAPDASSDSAAPAAEPSASLFSAVEVVEPTAPAAAGDAGAPLFLSADTPAGDKPAKKSPARKAAARKTKKADAESVADDRPADDPAADEKSDDKKSDEKKSTRKAAKKADDAEAAPAKKKSAKKSGKKAKAADSDDTADAPVAEIAEQPPIDGPAEEKGDAPAVADTSTGDAQDADESAADDTTNADTAQEIDADGESRSRRRRRGRRGRGRGRGDQPVDEQNDNAEAADTDGAGDDEEQAAPDAPADTESESADTSDDTETSEADSDDDATDDTTPTSKRRRRRRRRRGAGEGEEATSSDDPPNTVVHEREPRTKRVRDEVQGISGSTRLEAKRQRRRDGRDAGRRRPPILTESEFLARRESVERVMVIRERGANATTEDYTQVAVLEDGVLVEHFVTTETSQSMVGNIYLGRVQNVLPGMEAAFVDIGRGRNGVLYAGEVNWEAAGLDGRSRKIEQALKPGDYVLVQVSKDPIGHKGARLTTQISLAGRYLVYVPGGTSTGISRKLPDTERKRLKQILSKLVPDEAGVIIRTASEGVSAEELAADVARLESQWKGIEAAAAEHSEKASGTPRALYEEPDLLVRVVRDLFNEDFSKLVVEGDKAWNLVSGYVNDVAADLSERVEEFTKAHADAPDSFAVHRIDEQLAKALDRKVWLPSGGTLIIEHTEAMTVVDVNTGKFTGSGGNLEETVTRNNLEAAEEIVRQMRLRDIGGMIIVDFIDMVLESNRDLVLRRLTEALARDRTRHQVSEVTSLGLVQMTRKRLGTGLLEAFSTTCTACAGRGVIVHANPVEVRPASSDDASRGDSSSRRSRRKKGRADAAPETKPESAAPTQQPKAPHKPAAEHPLFRTMAHHDDEHAHDHGDDHAVVDQPVDVAPAAVEEKAEAAVEVVAAETAVEATPEAAPVVDEAPVADTAPAVGVVRRRRRAVRRPSAPTAVAPEAITVSSEEPPVTTVAPQASEPVVSVTRTPRRRTGRRAAGPPPSGD
ncbi:Rne/Rng family ribonuclease [Gordonia sp. (in: high G+C Gram-positive bacteria)]|uniref:Rne/Rng family ribonuclease n=1 Tax=Gordonia sp. (in: high G+C Gram-positive bacteria) TaxID=84139 RepID=UPI0033405635